MRPNEKRGLRAQLRTVALTAVALGAVVGTSTTLAAGEPRTKVILNGKPVPVFFNDGDSFRVLGGTYKGAKARLAGYNTLESYGSVHQWGDWTEKELYVLAKMATLHARAGHWKCETDGKSDTYGRMLMWCPELAEDLVRRGYAHVMSINDDPGKAQLVEAQRDAIEHRRGMWSHGVPKFVLTSLHSAEEDTDGSGTYNRLVSTDDAHSVKWKHTNKYSECQKVCHQKYAIDEAKVAEVIEALKADGAAAKWIGGLSDAQLEGMVYEFAEFHHIDRSVKKEHREDLKLHLLRNYVEQGSFGEQTASPSSCMIHVPFQRRFGTGRAECLK